MASTTMANHNFLAYTFMAILFMATIDFTVAQVGVCNGMLGSSLPSPSAVVALYNQNNIRRMRIYGPHQPTLQALAGSNIEIILDVPNTELPSIASSRDQAYAWVQNNVVNHPNVRFRYISVGNEVSPFRESRQYVRVLLVAMSNIYDAIQSHGYGNRIRVSTAIDTGLLESSYPPSNGAFRAEATTSFMRPIIQFLVNTRQPLLANIYPYFAYADAGGRVDLSYALFTSNGIDVDGTHYPNLFVAMVDAMYAAVAREGGSSLEIVVSESGWPSGGDNAAATMEYARTYNTNLVQHVRGGTGTPRRPGAIETYIFAMFDEDQKPGHDTERHFGLFQPNGQSKYGITNFS